MPLEHMLLRVGRRTATPHAFQFQLARADASAASRNLLNIRAGQRPVHLLWLTFHAAAFVVAQLAAGVAAAAG